MISKSTGQTIRVSAVMHALFSLEGEDVGEIITPAAIQAAIHFVEVCCQQTAFIAGRGELDKELQMIAQGPSDPGQKAVGGKSNEAFCLTLPGDLLDVSRLVNKAKKFRHRGGRDGALLAMKNLQKDGLGRLEEKKTKGSSVKTWLFRKTPIPSDQEDLDTFAAKLMQYGVSLLDYSRTIGTPKKVVPPDGNGADLKPPPRKSPRLIQQSSPQSSPQPATPLKWKE